MARCGADPVRFRLGLQPRIAVDQSGPTWNLPASLLYDVGQLMADKLAPGLTRRIIVASTKVELISARNRLRSVLLRKRAVWVDGDIRKRAAKALLHLGANATG